MLEIDALRLGWRQHFRVHNLLANADLLISNSPLVSRDNLRDPYLARFDRQCTRLKLDVRSLLMTS